MSYGVGIDAYFRRDGMVGFNWSRQESNFLADVRTVGTTELTGMNIDNFHGIFTYIREDLHPQAAPFVFGGLGATYYSFSDFLGREVSSETKFSTTWGAGVRVYPHEKIGVKFTGRWTPTYIKTDTEGYWCDYYGCWAVGDSDYSHQFELSGSLMLLF